MKLAIFSDIHIHDYKSLASYANGFNSRLLELFDHLSALVDDINSQKPDLVIFLGDIFDIKGVVKPSVGIEVFDILSRLEAPIYAIAGNHDMEADNIQSTSVNFIKYLNINNKVFNQPTLIDDMLFVPYVKTKTEFLDILIKYKDKFQYLFSHQLILPNYLYNKSEEILYQDIMNIAGSIYIFNGHNHASFTHHRLYNVGSPFKHNFNDCDRDACYLIFNTDNKQAEFRTVNKIEFVKVNESNYTTTAVKDKYVQLTVTKNKNSHNHIEKIKSAGAKGLKVRYLPEQKTTKGKVKADINTLDDLITSIIKHNFDEHQQVLLFDALNLIMREVNNEN